MRSLVAICMVGLLLFSELTHAQNKDTKAAPANSIMLKSANDSLQYALGAYMGTFMLRGGFSEINLQYFLTGLEDVYRRRPRALQDSTALKILTDYQTDNQLKQGKKEEEALFASIKDKPGIGKLPSGVQYTVLKTGKGTRPLETDTVIIHYKGQLADGTVFENTYPGNKPIITTPVILIAGLNEALQLMQPGASWQVYIPSSQGYGLKGNGTNIPPGTALSITIDLLEVKAKKAN